MLSGSIHDRDIAVYTFEWSRYSRLVYLIETIDMHPVASRATAYHIELVTFMNIRIYGRFSWYNLKAYRLNHNTRHQCF